MKDIMDSIKPGDVVPIMRKVTQVKDGLVYFASDDGKEAYGRYQDVRDALAGGKSANFFDPRNLNFIRPPYGWICPSCRRIHSPETPQCIDCNNQRYAAQAAV